jgi:fructose-specific phosphotransferase system IIC component
LEFYQHPQLWLIPFSLSVLLAARINRDRLTRDQMTMIRYATLMMIYISSTADIFINGVRESPWLTMVLAGLSVAGVIAGLMMRVRAFLFLGAAFLLLSVLTMIRAASVNLGWVWLWYVTGIAFGALIIYTFALFERKRQEMLSLVERLKHWQA